MVQARSIAPTKVCRCSLQSGDALVGLVPTTGCMIAEKPKKDAPMPAMPGGMGGMGGMDY